MLAYLIRRLWQMIPTLVGVVLLVFILFKYFGGDPAEILGGLNATPEQIEATREQLGLNEPAWYQFWLSSGPGRQNGGSKANANRVRAVRRSIV